MVAIQSLGSLTKSTMHVHPGMFPTVNNVNPRETTKQTTQKGIIVR